MRRLLAVVVLSSMPLAAVAAEPVLEFYNALLNHYFITIDGTEAAAIDQGAAGPGWHRTARVFGAYADATSTPTDAVPVCRFYGNVAAGGPNSHFYTADPAECAAVKLDIGWTYEGIAFHVRLPAGGQCPAGTTPVLRNYNGRFAEHDSNHRYTTDRLLHEEMTAIGWADERAVFCGDASITTPPRGGTIASGPSPFAAGCERVVAAGVFYPSAEVEPFVAVNPRAPDNLIGVWQQDRWSNGGARGVVAAASFDGGRSWQSSSAAFSRCTGGNAANGGDYVRATDPWVSFAPDGTAWQIAIAFTGGALLPGSSNAVLVSRSRDGGASWEPPMVLKQDGAAFFNDKESMTADPTDARYAYAMWDRIVGSQEGTSWFARTTNGGEAWEPARMIYDPGAGHSTINNQVVVLPDGTLVDFFSELTLVNGETTSASLAVVRSFDHGATWSGRTIVAEIHAVGASDPETGAKLRDGAGLGQIAADALGRVFVVWQDARGTLGSRDAVLIARSDDRGLTWSSPMQVNPDRGVPAFEPALAIARDGTIGVAYFDFRSNTRDSATLFADCWLARSTDGANWSEVHVDGPFDYDAAPDAGGLFLGDYQGLTAVGNAFVPFFARTNAGQPDNRTDIVVGYVPPP